MTVQIDQRPNEANEFNGYVVRVLPKASSSQEMSHEAKKEGDRFAVYSKSTGRKLADFPTEQLADHFVDTMETSSLSTP